GEQRRLSRVPMEYLHTRERDTFHEIPQHEIEALPPTMLYYLRNGKFNPKCRITTDTKTGNIVNKIIKSRVADLNVHCPRSEFDWRLSVSVEMPYTGEVVDEKNG